MASETVDPIDWPLLATRHKAVPPEFHVLHGANAGYKSQDLLRPAGRERPTLGMSGQRTARAATQGTKECEHIIYVRIYEHHASIHLSDMFAFSPNIDFVQHENQFCI